MRPTRMLALVALVALAACSASPTTSRNEVPRFDGSPTDSASAVAGNTMGSGH